MERGQLFRFEPFHFETVRALWYAPSGGADYGEVMSAVRKIRDGDVNSWYDGWTGLAKRLVHDADRRWPAPATGAARLRASNYMRTAEFFLAPKDVRRTFSAAFAQNEFYRGLEELGIVHARWKLPYRGAEMEAIYLPSPGANTLFVVHGGFDSTPEELFFTFGRAAQERGCDVLIYEGPGQGNLLRRHGLPFDTEWHKATGTALDAALGKRRYERVIGLGISMGGHFLARAAAKEHRLDGIVLCDYFPAPIEAFLHGLPKILHRPFLKKQAWLLGLIARRAKSDVQLNWVIENGKWTFGAADLGGLIDQMRRFDEDDWPAEVQAHVLAMTGSDEHFFDRALADQFAAKLKQAASVEVATYGRDVGGELHCRNGAYHLLVDSVFDWADAKLGTKDAPQVGV